MAEKQYYTIDPDTLNPPLTPREQKVLNEFTRGSINKDKAKSKPPKQEGEEEIKDPEHEEPEIT